MELLTKLGIDWRLLIAQAVNFVVLLILLQRFLYKPLIGMLEKREARLKKGLELSDAMEVKAKKMEEEHMAIVRDARSEAERIISSAVNQAETSRTELLETARTEAKRIVDEGKSILVEQKNLMIESARKEVATLVVDSARKIMADLNMKSIDSATIANAVEKIGK
jgi:F-type H+-transporting ATPase subunit b